MTRPSRRTLLGAAVAVPVLAGSGCASTPTTDPTTAPTKGPTTGPRRETPDRAALPEVRRLEREYDATIGFYAARTRAGARVLAHRAEARVPVHSVFKAYAAAAVLRDLDRDGEVLDRLVRYTRADLVTFSPVTEVNVDRGMTVRELCDAAVRISDNTAANLLLRELGGPPAITRFARSIGDRATRLDRWEPELNSATRATPATPPPPGRSPAGSSR